MYAPGHVGLALAIFAPVAAHLHRRERTRLAVVGTAAVAGVTLLPDLDLFVPWLLHRGPTHTVWFALIAGASTGTVGAIGSALRAGSARRALGVGAFGAGVGALAVLAHLAGDVLTPMGIRPIAPLSDASFTFDLVYSRNPVANAAFLAAGSVATLAQLSVGIGPRGAARSGYRRAVRGLRRAVADGSRRGGRDRRDRHETSTPAVEPVVGAAETDD